jgi:hypothetical protein
MKQLFACLGMSITLSIFAYSSPPGNLALRPALTFDEQESAIIASHPERIIDTRSANCRFTSLEWGDYLHLNFKINPKGNLSLFGTDDRLTYFVISHKGKLIRVHYQTVEIWIPQAGGYEKISRISSASLGSTDFLAWWQQQCRKVPEPKLFAHYEKQLNAYR